MSLAQLCFKPEYHKDSDDIAADFYVPCFHASHAYDRITGYFSSAVYTLVWSELKEFLARGGRIRILCSPVLSPSDIEGMRTGYAAMSDYDLAAQLSLELKRMLADEHLSKPARVLACLIVDGAIQVRLATLSDDTPADVARLFHDKVGLFADLTGNAVGFRGSMNETFLGLSARGNLESIDVFPNWVGDARDADRVNSSRVRFESLWNNNVAGVLVRELPALTEEELRTAARHTNWELAVDELAALEQGPAGEETGQYEAHLGPKKLRPHQTQFLEAWRANGRRGIAKHATGAGKTFTAIAAITECLADNYAPVVIVPSQLLQDQWKVELRAAGISVLEVGGGSSEWRDGQGRVKAWLSQSSPDERQAVVAVVNSAAEAAFRNQIPRRRKILLVADECHRLGSSLFRDVLRTSAKARLGLSATPERAGDPQGTQAIFEYFEGVVGEAYDLADAVRDGVLTRYEYYPHAIDLTTAEREEWDELTDELRPLMARFADEEGGAFQSERVKMLLIRRARIAKKAVNKVPLARRIIEKNYDDGQRWLIYCEDSTQLRTVRAEIDTLGVPTLEYHTNMEGDEPATLESFRQNGGVLVSIKCLDEGIDIPATTHALILASSRNPREFIQRRGRVLRRYPGKRLAFVHDALVVPRMAERDDDRADRATRALVLAELKRANEFAQGASNNAAALSTLDTFAVSAGIDLDDYDELVESGFEEDEDRQL